MILAKVGIYTTINVLINVLQDGMKMRLDGVSNVDVHVIHALDQETHVLNVREIQPLILPQVNAYSIYRGNLSQCSTLITDPLTLPMNVWVSINNTHLLSM